MVSSILFANKPKQKPSFDAKSTMKKEMMPIQRIDMPKVTMCHLAHFAAQFGIVYLRQRITHTHTGTRFEDRASKML